MFRFTAHRQAEGHGYEMQHATHIMDAFFALIKTRSNQNTARNKWTCAGWLNVRLSTKGRGYRLSFRSADPISARSVNYRMTILPEVIERAYSLD